MDRGEHDEGTAALNPAMLQIAREARGFTQAKLAEELGITQSWLSKVEAGIGQWRPELTDRLAETLSFPADFFFQRARAFGLPLSVHGMYRKKAALTKTAADRLTAQLNIRRFHLEQLLKSVDPIPVRIPFVDLDDYGGDVEEIARTVRRHFTLPSGPVPNLAEAIEEAGGVVIRCNFYTDKVDGVSFVLPGMPPLIFLREGMPGDRDRFTMAHELGHIVMHWQQPAADMEEQANRFAAELLMPNDEIKPYLRNLTMTRLAALKRIWRVAMQALIYKAKTLETMTPRQIRYLWFQIGRAGYRKNEPGVFPADEARTLREMVAVHLSDLEYSLDDLSVALKLYVEECQQMYCSKAGLRVVRDDRPRPPLRTV